MIMVICLPPDMPGGIGGGGGGGGGIMVALDTQMDRMRGRVTGDSGQVCAPADIWTEPSRGSVLSLDRRSEGLQAFKGWSGWVVVDMWWLVDGGNVSMMAEHSVVTLELGPNPKIL